MAEGGGGGQAIWARVANDERSRRETHLRDAIHGRRDGAITGEPVGVEGDAVLDDLRGEPDAEEDHDVARTDLLVDGGPQDGATEDAGQAHQPEIVRDGANILRAWRGLHRSGQHSARGIYARGAVCANAPTYRR